jgi:glucose-1-phosphate thymidylyltransferase
MKGIVLAGGSGSRLSPLTEVTNKHLLPIGKEPMIFHPIRTLASFGITEICVVVGGNSVGDVLNLLQDGSRFGVSLTYRYQQGAKGIAHAIGLAERFAGGDSVAVILGDNLFVGDLKTPALDHNWPGPGAQIYLKEVPDPARFGVARLNDSKVTGIVEKPKEFVSNWAVTGLYAYDFSVFQRIRSLKPSARGELEVTDLNNTYIEEGLMKARFLGDDIFWSDMGTHESMSRVNSFLSAQEDD